MLLDTEQDLDLGSFRATQDSVEEYLRSVGDALPIYRETGFVPPLYLAASALGSFLKTIALPPGAIHSLQEIETLSPVAIGGEVKVDAFLEKPRRRAGLEFITAICTVQCDGEAVLKSKSTVLVPSSGQPDGPNEGNPPQKVDRKSDAPESGLPVVSREINQQQLNAYAKASGDDNPLHLDPEFAAGTQFGGIIAHGMLTLAFISEMMATAHGADWLKSGALRVRFKGAAYLGDTLDARGSLAKENGPSRTFSVGVWNSGNGQELISGTASCKIS